MESIKLKALTSNPRYKHGIRKAFLQDKELPAEARFLLVLLMSHKGSNSGTWIGMKKLSAEFGKNRDTTRRYLKILEKSGHLQISSRGIGRSNFYAPSYSKISSGSVLENTDKEKFAEKTIHQPDEIPLNRSIDLGNKDNALELEKEKTQNTHLSGKSLFDQKRKELGLV